MSNFNINEDAQSGGEFSGSQSSANGDIDSKQVPESAFPDEDEDTITMLDVIEREDKLEEEASAVLGNSDEKNCTYPKGYISRQALYSCATCSDGSDNQAAICLACSLECHDNHEVYELYTKRNYRCDCGNSKFKPTFECKLMDKHHKKSSLNENNKYNHNFSGRYCTCDKRYPPDENDTSAESQDEMWQCIVCEDWYHTKHLESKELPTKFDELICGQCVDKLDFVHYYYYFENLKDSKGSETATTSEESEKLKCKDETPTTSSTSTSQTKESAPDASLTVDSKTIAESSTVSTVCESDTNDSQAENKEPKLLSQLKGECKLEKLKGDFLSSVMSQSKVSPDDKKGPPKGSQFWSDVSWRSKLCKCQKCMDMYKAKDCEYLLDEKDTVQFYETQGKAIAKDGQTPYERGIVALNKMNRAAVVEALHGYDELKADLSDYLRKFADTKKVVRKEDIHEFFDRLKSKKRPRFEFS